MNALSVLFAMLQADFRERTRRYGFLAALCLVLYLGFAVNTGQVFVKLQDYRGVYNSAWVGGLMVLVITFFLGLFGFYLVKNTVDRDERTGVGQIIATTPITRPLYLLGKWLSNFAVLSALIVILALAAVLMQLIQREVAELQLWALLSPFLLIALPMMALVAALAVFFESVSWLKGGFGNLAYFGVFMVIFSAGIFLPQYPWLDVTGVTLIGASMKAAAQAAFPSYNNSLVLSMASDQPLQTFVWSGLTWTLPLILQRLLWLVISVGLVLLGVPFFHRFDPNRRSVSRRKKAELDPLSPREERPVSAPSAQTGVLHPLPALRFRPNFLRLVGSELKLLVNGLKWYWLAGMAVLWLGCVLAQTESVRNIGYMLSVLWPVLIWSQLGQREARCRVEPLIFPTPRPLIRLLLSAWLAGVLVTALAASGVLLGRALSAQPLGLLAWALAVVFIPTLALTLGAWSRTSKVFEVAYPILWYLGPLNRDNGLAGIDFLGFHAGAPANVHPLLFAGFILVLLGLAFLGRRRQMEV